MPDTTNMDATAAATIHRTARNACRKIAHATLRGAPLSRPSPSAGSGPTVLAIPPGYLPVPRTALSTAPGMAASVAALYAAAGNFA